MNLLAFFRQAPRIQASLVFEVTQACQHHCLHCYNVWKGPRPYPQGELDTAETLALFDQLIRETRLRQVTLTGGEPLLRPDLFELVDGLKARGLEVNLISNGTLLDDAALDRLLPNQIGVFELPLLGPTAEVHDRLSGAPGAFNRVTLAITRLKAARQAVVAVFVATRLNLPFWPRTAELAFALGVDAIMFNRFNPGGEGLKHVQELQASPAELKTALEFAQAFSEKYDYPISCSIAMPPCLFDHSLYPRLGFGFCSAGTPRAYYTVDPMGNLRPCNHSPLILGNLREKGFWSLADSQPARKFFRARPGFCRGCRMEDLCLGGCKAAAEAGSGSAQDLDPFLAAFGDQAVRP